MSLKAKVEAIIYAAEEPVTLEQVSLLLREAVLAELAAARENEAIGRADAAAEAAYNKIALLPELAPDSAEQVSPESAPETPQEAVPDAQDAAEPDPEAAVANLAAPETTSRKRKPPKTELEIAQDKAVRSRVREILAELLNEYASEERGIEIRQVAGGFRMATKPEHHDVVRAFAKSLKPPIRLSLAALETLAVIAYKQPITAPEIADIRGVESASVLGTLLDRKLITTAGRKQVIGRPMQYKTSKDFLLRFGLNEVNELPSMEEFSQLASEGTVEVVAAGRQAPSLFEAGAEAAKNAAEKLTEQEADSAAEAEESEISQPPVAESETMEAHYQGSPQPEAQEIAPQAPSDAAEAADSQPQSETDSD